LRGDSARWRALADSLVLLEGARPVPDSDSYRVVALGADDADGVALVATVVTSPLFRRGDAWLALQRDDAMRHPLADVGARVTVADFGHGVQATALVLARRRFFGLRSYCDERGRRTPYNGFAYLLDSVAFAPSDTAALSSHGLSRRAVVLPARLVSAPAAPVPAAARAALERVRRAIEDSTRDSAAARTAAQPTAMTANKPRLDAPADEESSLDAYPLRGPAGPLYATSFRSGGDPFAFEFVIADAAGRVVARARGRYDVRAVGDMNGDGVDEIVTDRGVIAWSAGGARWVFQTAERALYCD
jgi:hypothetical protein